MQLTWTLPESKIWRMRSFFATPRDMIPGLKLQHRNLYVAGHDPNDSTCRACACNESQLHLCECPVIWQGYWTPVLSIMEDTGMPRPRDDVAFLATGALSQDKVIDRDRAGMWFLAWRCLYAEIVRSRVEALTLDLDKALKRYVAMIIGRLKAYGAKWRRWVDKSRHQRDLNTIPKRHQDKTILRSNPVGEYDIHDAILHAAHRLQLM